MMMVEKQKFSSLEKINASKKSATNKSTIHQFIQKQGSLNNSINQNNAMALQKIYTNAMPQTNLSAKPPGSNSIHTKSCL